jgi:transposase-like protein
LSFGGEKKSEWLKAFNDLVNRGLRRVLLFICDDSAGISTAIKSVFPNSLIQKCFFHLKRNVKRNVSPKAYQEIAARLDRIKNSPDFETGKEEEFLPIPSLHSAHPRSTRMNT